MEKKNKKKTESVKIFGPVRGASRKRSGEEERGHARLASLAEFFSVVT